MKPVFASRASSARGPGSKRRRAVSASPAARAGLAVAVACATGLGAAGQAAEPAGPAAAGDTAVTIYSSARPGGVPADYYRPVPGRGSPGAFQVPGYAMVRQERRMPVANGRSTVRFTDVAALIDPTTVTFASLSDPATRVLEQDFRFDLVSTEKLLQRYVDRQVTIERGQDAAPVSGTLLSAGDGLVIRGADGSLSAVRDYTALRFPELPGGLITRPTLEWQLDAPKGGEQRTRVTYQTGGITWWADYNLTFSEGRDAGSGLLDVAAWVSIVNQSGATFPDAKLKLIAGDVHRAPQPPSPRVMMAMAEDARAREGGFAEQSFDEFHLYTLGRRTTLPDQSTKQIELFDQARRVPAQRQLVFRGTPDYGVFGEPMVDRNFGVQGASPRVETFLQFRNERSAGLGIPLPAGRIRVSRLDPADGSLEFIGEDVIDHTPRDETVRVKLGSSFDVVGERRQQDFSTDTRGRWMEEEIAIELRNHKDQDVEVQVLENLYRWANWTIVSSSQPHTREDARNIAFAVKVPKNGATTVRYRVRYSW